MKGTLCLLVKVDVDMVEVNLEVEELQQVVDGVGKLTLSNELYQDA